MGVVNVKICLNRRLKLVVLNVKRMLKKRGKACVDELMNILCEEKKEKEEKTQCIWRFHEA